MQVLKVVDEDIAHKVDIDYIADRFREVQSVSMTYICTSEGGEEDEWVDDELGLRYIVIHLPYKVVKRMDDVRSMMLQRAKERLGLVPLVSLN